jgi:hypothetical protein
MATYFILRSPYLPANRSIFRLEAPSPLAWFQAVWSRLREEADVTSKALLDVGNLYYFEGFTENIRSKELAAPADSAELKTLLSKNWYSNNVECRDGYVLVETDDDEVELAFWWVSEEVFQAKQDLFACYTAAPLPAEIGSGDFDPGCDVAATGHAGAAGTVFCVFVTVWDSGNLDGLPGPVAVRGVRLPGFADWLRATAPGSIEITGLRSHCRGHLTELDWLATVARHNAELDLPALLRRLAEVSPQSAADHWKEIREGTASEDELRKNVHWLKPWKATPDDPPIPTVIMQGCANSIEFRLYDGFNWHVWFLFDDLWASAHPVLARSLLRFAMPGGSGGPDENDTEDGSDAAENG